MKIEIVVVALALAAPAHAYRLRYNVAKPDPLAILARVEAATGLNFEAKCQEWLPNKPPQIGYHCDVWKPVHGWIITGPGKVEVEVFQAAPKEEKRAAAVTVTAELKKAIGAAVLNR